MRVIYQCQEKYKWHAWGPWTKPFADSEYMHRACFRCGVAQTKRVEELV